MKKILLFASALAGLFLAASCQQENLEPQQMDGTVKFTVEAPGAIATKTIADGQNVDVVHYAVYKTNSNETHAIEVPTERPLAQGFVPMSDKKANIEFNLLQDQKYTVIFWAQVSQDDNGQNDYYELGDLRAISMKKDAENNIVGNEEARAAFFAWYSFETYEHKDHVVTLKRPFAQLNLLTTLESLTPTQPGQTTGYTIDIEKSTVTVEGLTSTFYPYAQPVLGGTQGKAEETNETFTFTLEDTPAKQGIGEGDNKDLLKVNGKDYHYVSMNYFFVPVDEYTVNLTYGIKTDKGSIENTVVSVPVKKNFRTNVIGNLLTKESKFEIVVDAEFEVPETVVGEEWSQSGNYEYTVNAGAPATTLKAILDHADAAAKAAATKAEGPVVKINLAENVEWETGAGIGSTPLLPEDSPISAVVINGNGKTFTATGNGVGQIRLANGSLLTFNNVKVVDHSVSYAETSWEYGYLEFGGNLAFNDCQFVNAIMMESENAAFTNCSFNSNKDNEYAVWVNEGNTTFNGCTFTGARGLKVHEAYGSEVASVVVDGCTFGPLTMKPGIALGDLNAETSVTIKNSTFDSCQAGDQKLYMYETDTDVTTFTFVTENNIVVPSGDEVIEQGEGVVMVATAAGFAKAIEEAEAGDVIKVAGSVVLPTGVITKTAGALTIEGYTEDAEVAFSSTPGGADGGLNCYADGMDLLFKNITVVSPNTGSAYSGGFGRAKSVTFENCEYIGQYRAVNAYTKFIECTIDPQTSYIYTDYANVDFTRCTFNCSEGKGVQVYNDGNTTNTVINVTDCTFTAAKQGSTWDGKPVTAIDINSNGEKFTVNIEETTVDGFPEGLVSGESIFNIKGGAENVTVVVDGLEWIRKGAWRDADGNAVVYSGEALQYALDANMNIILGGDIAGDVVATQKEGVQIVINGNDKKYDGMITVDGKSEAYASAGLTVKNLTFNASSISGDACIRLGDGTDATRYTSNVVVENCTFAVEGAAGVKSYTGGDKNLKLSGCTATAAAHSLLQVAGVDKVLVEGCTIYSKNGMNFNNSVNVTINECEADVKGYAARFGAGSAADTAVETYAITKSTLKSACEDGDAVIILRGTAANSTLTLTNTTLVGDTEITNNTNANVVIK